MMQGLSNVLSAVDNLKVPKEKRTVIDLKFDDRFQRVKLY